MPIPWGSVQRGSGDGDVLYTNSTLALDADTGDIVWYFQHIPNDEWDLDHPFARLIVETEVSPRPGGVEWMNNAITPGGRRKIVTGIPGKTGIVWYRWNSPRFVSGSAAATTGEGGEIDRRLLTAAGFAVLRRPIRVGLMGPAATDWKRRSSGRLWRIELSGGACREERELAPTEPG